MHNCIGKGEVRQLAIFPETTHEEVIRTFVNGGYQATLEPASFMPRWVDDFYERQRKKDKAQRFWDYALAVVPPGGFKGGGELVVLSRTSDPELAFKLADYLATDPEGIDVKIVNEDDAWDTAACAVGASAPNF
jgi:hypothetical protein